MPSARACSKPGGTIIEGTSGNTGMGLAIVAAVTRLPLRLHDHRQAVEGEDRRAEGVRRRGDRSVRPTSIRKTRARTTRCRRASTQEIPGSWKANQYDNLSNAAAHYEQTGPEIWEQTDGRVTHLVVGVGTGGTVSGAGRYLKERNPGDQGVGHRHLRLGVQEIQGDRHLRQARDLPVHHRGHRRGLSPAERRLRRSSITSRR